MIRMFTTETLRHGEDKEKKLEPQITQISLIKMQLY
jgi:hypothetical protein